MTYDLVETARRAEGSDLLPKVSFGVMNAEVLILKMADRIEALEAESAKLREYYEAREVISNVGLFFASDAMLKREREARAALQDKETTND